MMRVYADNAATTAMSPKSLEVMTDHLKKYYGNPSSLYEIGQLAKTELENAREKMAELLGCSAKELHFTSGGSESDNQAIMSMALYGMRKGKKHIITSVFEHHAVLHCLDHLKNDFGFEVTYLPCYENGVVRPEDLEKAIRPDTCLVTIMYVNNEIGTIQPINELAEITKKHEGVYFHTDAVQAVGHLPINIDETKIDMLSLSGHKFHGPKGVGALYVRKGVPIKPLIYGGAQENHRRAGTENVAGICAMVAALDECLSKLPERSERVRKLRDKIQNALLEVPHSILNGDKDKRVPSILNMCFEGIEGEGMLLYLDDAGICVSSGSACTSGSLDPSHVIMALGRPHEIAHGSLRISLSEYTTEEEADYIIQEVPKVIDKIRQFSPVWKDLERGLKEYVIQ